MLQRGCQRRLWARRRFQPLSFRRRRRSCRCGQRRACTTSRRLPPASGVKRSARRREEAALRRRLRASARAGVPLHCESRRLERRRRLRLVRTTSATMLVLSSSRRSFATFGRMARLALWGTGVGSRTGTTSFGRACPRVARRRWRRSKAPPPATAQWSNNSRSARATTSCRLRNSWKSSRGGRRPLHRSAPPAPSQKTSSPSTSASNASSGPNRTFSS
mmetsp:Transcript_16604/g.54222  ORF Transcript_16604/g.54222 Transcript_16604/m.54222 type:complete len:219 (+) Transcript_16604:307-963(+)